MPSKSSRRFSYSINPQIKFTICLILNQICSSFCTLYFIHTVIQQIFTERQTLSSWWGLSSEQTRHGLQLQSSEGQSLSQTSRCLLCSLCVLASVAHQVPLVSLPKHLNNSSRSPTQPQATATALPPCLRSLFYPPVHFLNTLLFL